MGGVCARQFCSAPAIARVDFDGEARVVWLDDLDDLGGGGLHKPAAACCLCRRHADSLTPPRNWEMRDLRSPAAPGPVPAEASSAWSPSLFASVDPGAVLDATSPLLSRAFHGAR